MLSAMRTTLFFVLLALCTVGVKDPDIWWHLKTGQMIAYTHSVPHTDPFSWSMAGSPWVSHEWMSELVLYGLFAAGGFPLLVLVFGCLAALAFFLASQTADAPAFPAGLAASVGAVGAATVFGPRPQIFSILLASTFFYVLEKRRWPWVLVPLTVIWANLHGGFAVGLGIIFLYAVGALLERDRSRFRQLALLFLVCLAVIPLNPHGVKLYTYPLQTLMSPAMQSLLGDWAPPDFRRASSAGIILLLAATFGLLAKSGKSIGATRLLLLMVFTYATLRSGRHVPLLALTAVPIIAERLPQTRRSAPWWLAIVAALVAVPVIYGAAVMPPQLARGPVPSGAVDWLDRNRPTGNLYNWYDWGGYLIWRGHKVWIDGRPDMYGDHFVFKDKEIGDAKGDWRAVFAERNVRAVMIMPQSDLARALAADAEWVKGYEDQLSIVYVRR